MLLFTDQWTTKVFYGFHSFVFVKILKFNLLVLKFLFAFVDVFFSCILKTSKENHIARLIFMGGHI